MSLGTSVKFGIPACQSLKSLITSAPFGKQVLTGGLTFLLCSTCKFISHHLKPS